MQWIQDGGRCVNEDSFIQQIFTVCDKKLRTLLGAEDAEEIKQTWEKRESARTFENKILTVPLTASDAQLMNDIRRNMSFFPGLVTGKKGIISDPESFRVTVHPTVSSAGVSRDGLQGQITHEYQKRGRGSQKRNG